MGAGKSFLTTLVVITMSLEVVRGELCNTDFSGKFFMFQGVQTPAQALVLVLRSTLTNSASLERVEALIILE